MLLHWIFNDFLEKVGDGGEEPGYEILDSRTEEAGEEEATLSKSAGRISWYRLVLCGMGSSWVSCRTG